MDTCTLAYLLCSKMQSSTSTVVDNIRISILSIHYNLYYFQTSIPNEEHKSHDGNYSVGDTESLGCEWWGRVRITVESGYLAHALIGITAKLYAPHSEVR